MVARFQQASTRPLADPGDRARFLLAPLDGNAWLDLAYYGPDVPNVLADHFLKPVRAPEPGGDSPAAVEAAGKRGSATAAADIQAGRPVVLYYGKPWSAGNPLVDDCTGLKVEVVGGCGVTRATSPTAGSGERRRRSGHGGTRRCGFRSGTTAAGR